MVFSKEISAEISVGFSGSAEIKDVISASIDAKGTYKYVESVNETVVIPAYTYWARQAYARKKTDNYTGQLSTWTMVNSGGVWVPTLESVDTHSGTNINGAGGGVKYTTY